jgi:hypothetical protein
VAAPLVEDPSDRAGPAASYEALREAVLAGRPEGWRHGLGVLVSRGMAAWISAWSSLAPAGAGTTADLLSDLPISSPSPQTPDPRTPNALSFLPQAEQVVAVLGQMALAHT